MKDIGIGPTGNSRKVSTTHRRKVEPGCFADNQYGIPKSGFYTISHPIIISPETNHVAIPATNLQFIAFIRNNTTLFRDRNRNPFIYFPPGYSPYPPYSFPDTPIEHGHVDLRSYEQRNPIM